MPINSITDTLSLPNSQRVPRLGFGVYRSPPDQCIQSCLKALDVGYRHIDTAQFYANEAEVGQALRASGLPRDQVFVTTKILSPAGSADATYKKLLDSVEKIGGPGGYVDLFLIHSSSSGPSGRKQLWQALERLHQEGHAKSIGVSNFGVKHIEELRSFAKVWPPHVNQIEVNYILLFLYRLSQETAPFIYKDLNTNVLSAPPLVSAADDRRILQAEWHHRRSLLPHRAQLQSQRPHTRRSGSEIQQVHTTGSDPICTAEGMGATAQDRQPRADCRQRRRFRLCPQCRRP
jgi:aryl-alcohol dehydrogenase-like predicted oxidoreductase